jgi:hypothetical protein
MEAEMKKRVSEWVMIKGENESREGRAKRNGVEGEGGKGYHLVWRMFWTGVNRDRRKGGERRNKVKTMG